MISDLREVATRLAQWFAQRDPAFAQARVTDLQRSDAGYSNITVLGRLEWAQAGRLRAQDIVLRVQPEASSVYPDCDIERQYRVLQALAGR